MEKYIIDGTKLQLAMLDFTLADFIGLAQISKVNIFTEDNKIRNDFDKIEEEIVSFYSSLPKSERNKFLKRVRQISKYNKIHKKKNK